MSIQQSHAATSGAAGAALYARVCSPEHQREAEHRLQRLRDDAVARSDAMVPAVLELASGGNDERPQRTKLNKLLSNRQVGVLVVAQRGRDRLTHCGCGYLTTLLTRVGRRGARSSGDWRQARRARRRRCGRHHQHGRAQLWPAHQNPPGPAAQGGVAHVAHCASEDT